MPSALRPAAIVTWNGLVIGAPDPCPWTQTARGSGGASQSADTVPSPTSIVSRSAPGSMPFPAPASAGAPCLASLQLYSAGEKRLHPADEFIQHRFHDLAVGLLAGFRHVE